MEATGVLISYKECQRNFAATIGMTTHDGCGEYTKNTQIFGSLLCDACGCHRSFHRKVEIEGVHDGVVDIHPSNQDAGGSNNGNPEIVELELRAIPRRRKPYTSEERRRMREFGNYLEWKMPGGNKERRRNLLRFCASMGISRMQFKSWLHTNK